jgi:DNA-binding transcriptional LysR family regulator
VTLRQLSYWLATVEHGSFRRAAESLHVSQPSLSQQILALERALGGPLLERLPRSIQLTSAGAAFLPEARATVQAADRAVHAARRAFGLEGGQLEIATVGSLAVNVLPRAIAQWRAAYPGVTIGLREYSHRTLLEDAVRGGVGHVAVGPVPLNWTGTVVDLGFEEFKVVLAPDDPLAAHDAVPLSALAERDWVLFEPRHGLADLTKWVFRSAGIQPRCSVETAQVEGAARLAASGLGPALLPGNVIPAGLDAAVRSLEPRVGRRLAAFGRDPLSDLARAFIAALPREEFAEQPAGALVVP